MNFNYWEVWTPEVVHWNSARGGWSFYSINRSIRIRVNSTGHVVWDPDAAFTSPCDMDLELYPFDTQYCTLIFGSWTYSSNQVIFTGESVVNHEWLSTNPEWEVSNIAMGRNDVDMAPSKDHYSAISATIHMKRHTSLYQYYIFLPYAVATAFILCSFSESHVISNQDHFPFLGSLDPNFPPHLLVHHPGWYTFTQRSLCRFVNLFHPLLVTEFLSILS